MTQPLKFVDHSIDDYAMQVTYDPATGTGNVVYNLSLVKNVDFEYAVSILKDAYKTGVSVSGLVKFCPSGEKIAGYVVPEGRTAICTICSITFDGLLIRRGVPDNPYRRRGGRDREPCPAPVSRISSSTSIRPSIRCRCSSPSRSPRSRCDAERQREYPREYPGVPHGSRTAGGERA